jgi:diguanylate cyclase (GGDEF)-like protein
MVAGDLVNTAARVQSAATPGAVLVGEATRRATEAAVVYQDAGDGHPVGTTMFYEEPSWLADSQHVLIFDSMNALTPQVMRGEVGADHNHLTGWFHDYDTIDDPGGWKPLGAGELSRDGKRLAALRAGAWEFLSQPLDGEVLLLKLQSYMKAKRAMDRLSDDSLVDQTTGLYNLRGLARRAREIGAEAARRHESLACVALALDVEPAADSDDQSEEVTARLVEHLGAVCRRSGRLSDAIGRLGQAEFGIIAPATEATGAVRLVERLRGSLESEPVDVHGVEQPLKIRAGYCAVADFSESAVDAVEMLLRATTALRHVREERTSGHHIRAFEDVSAGSAP